MSVKARETLESKQISIPTLIIMILVLVGYTFLYNQVINNVADYQLKTIIGVVCLVVMIGLFLLSLRYVTTSFEMLLTHDRLIIDRKIVFFKKTVSEIRINDIKKILPIEDVVKVEGTKQNFTLTNIEGKRKYTVLYERQGKICSIKIQCSGNFYDSLKKLVKIR
ncbi:hypothetical protein GH810_08965 [Acetobacterium paludosum]|uniref:Uncharacterized protein n=1 Tax=Acetobacterium paludosum TaxID=52693 RepID=A0A923HU96_9FIRM|nr:hypothetical protein [Acetobacterium paludosum]MBC3888436.1 hypothetical protein [Acetobacterium paludosum]